MQNRQCASCGLSRNAENKLSSNRCDSFNDIHIKDDPVKDILLILLSWLIALPPILGAGMLLLTIFVVIGI
jgi:hypothetical protein